MFAQAVLLPRLLFLSAAGASAPSSNCNCSRVSCRRRTRTDRGSRQPPALRKWDGHTATGPYKVDPVILILHPMAFVLGHFGLAPMWYNRLV
jgi:hypothetical protein